MENNRSSLTTTINCEWEATHFSGFRNSIFSGYCESGKKRRVIELGLRIPNNLIRTFLLFNMFNNVCVLEEII